MLHMISCITPITITTATTAMTIFHWLVKPSHKFFIFVPYVELDYFSPNALPVRIAPKARWNMPPPIRVNGECCAVSFFISSICTIGSDVALIIAINSLMSGLFSPYHIGTTMKSYKQMTR